MSLACPKCSSRNLRYARLRETTERVLMLVGVRPLRCRDCDHRFISRTWRVSSIRWAKCPRCWRMDLSTWSDEDYHVPVTMRLAAALGARRYRCEYCRLNFTSFRPRKERFHFRRKRASSGPRPLGSGAFGPK